MKREMNILVVGVGGQGNILFSKILGETLLSAGYDVKISEVHGMAQRGGSVVTYVKASEKVFSPLVDIAQADFIIAFEKLEALRWLEYLKRDGTLIYADYEIPPISVTTGSYEYPDVEKVLKEIGVKACKVEIKKLLSSLGDARVQNTLMLGFFSKFLSVEEALFISSIEKNVKKELIEINLKAFDLGRRIENM